MHKRLLTPFITFVLFFSAVPAHPYTLMYTDASAAIQIKWATTTIPIAISASMSSAPNIMGGDVEGAVRRALRRWSDAGGFQFTVTTSAVQNTAQDNVNLISVTNTGAFSLIRIPGVFKKPTLRLIRRRSFRPTERQTPSTWRRR
jgi:hypothetical protein